MRGRTRTRTPGISASPSGASRAATPAASDCPSTGTSTWIAAVRSAIAGPVGGNQVVDEAKKHVAAFPEMHLTSSEKGMGIAALRAAVVQDALGESWFTRH